MPKKKDRWDTPGWKIEPKYIDKVLIGNWFEEREQEGIGRSCLSNSNEYKSNLITNHIVDYQVPMFTPPTPIRKWNSRKSSWVPEKLDRREEVRTQLPRISNRKGRSYSGSANLPNKNASSLNTYDEKQCPIINVPQAYDHEPVVIKYRHRNTDVTPFFPTILRKTTNKPLVLKWNM